MKNVSRELQFYRRLRPIHYILGIVLVSILGVSALTIVPHTVLPQVSTTASPSATILHVGCVAKQVNSVDPQAVEPDPQCTPGIADPVVTQSNIHQTICVAGYTAGIRTQKPTSYFANLKTEQIVEYGYTDQNPRIYEEDHLISLELGGSNEPGNLWPEFGASPNEKDKIENYLHAQVCSDTISLSEAQREISTDWYSVFTHVVR